MKRLTLVLLILAQFAGAQEILSDRIKGLRVYGAAEAGFPVADTRSRSITVEFDVAEQDAPDLHIRVLHCDRNWQITQNGFVNDPLQNKSKAPLQYDPAPDGVRNYRYHYRVSIPGIVGIDRFSFSGNYVFEIMDERWSTVLARGRFFVAEQTLPLVMKVTNRSLPSTSNPYNQVNKVEIGFSIPRPEDNSGEMIFPLLIKVADVYRNRQLFNPWRIDPDDRNGNTYIDGFGTGTLKYIVDNVTPGNTYRRIDMRDVVQYPEDRLLKSSKGADVARFQMPPGSDSHGISVLSTGSRSSDYVPFRFELSSESQQWNEVYVVGDFNGWKVSPEWLMSYDGGTQRYYCDVVLRRGAYDYQYVVGPDDWIAIEGNDWRTANIYSGVVYYQETKLGGYDRIIGFIQHVSSGAKRSASDY